MKRYSAYDPPEYIGWSARPDLLRRYRKTIEEDPARQVATRDLGRAGMLDLYRGLLRFRLHDIALQRWVKQGVITKAWLGTGEEAVSIGAVHALRREGARGDVVGPMIRNAGACHEMGMPLADMLRGYLATADSPTAGKDLHVGDLDHGVVAPISMVGSLATVMNGYALAFKRRGEGRIALTWVGDGATKHGEVHEALNFAAVQRLPIVFVIQNNQVALGTRFDQHHAGPDFYGWGRAYGAALFEADGNHVLDMYAACRLAAERCRQGDGPVFVAAETFRMGGHATHDVREGRRTFDASLFEEWGLRDPIGMYEEYLATGPLPLDEEEPASDLNLHEERNRRVLATLEADVEREVEEAAEAALASLSDRMPEPEVAGVGVYATQCEELRKT